MEATILKNLVLLFKAVKEKDAVDPFEKVLHESGYNSVCIPVLSFGYTNLDVLYRALCSPDQHSGIVFTSQRAVEAVTMALQMHDKHKEWENVCCDKWKSKLTFVVGKATASAAKDRGFTPLGEGAGSAESLVPIILQELDKDAGPLLFPCGNLRRETIPQALKQKGIALEGITVYETLPHPDLHTSLQHLLQNQGYPEYGIYFSPSGVDFTKDTLKDLKFPTDKIKWIAIGPTTEKSLYDHGLPVAATSSQPTPIALQQAITQVSPGS